MTSLSMEELRGSYAEKEVTVTLMCTGNRRGEFNEHGETMGLPWGNGSISTARWSGASLSDVLAGAGFNLPELELQGFRFITFWGTENYHVSIPLGALAREGQDIILAQKMNGAEIPRDHGYPLRVVVPGYVGARSVKWLSKVVIMKEEVAGMHQTGIAYKQLGPNFRTIPDVPKAVVREMPPIDVIPVTSAITSPEPGTWATPGAELHVAGYAYSGAGRAIIRVDVSLDGGITWGQGTLQRATNGDSGQGTRSGRAWAWVQWRYSGTVSPRQRSVLHVVCKAIDDQYNQQPHSVSPIWNVRGILNTSWGNVEVPVAAQAAL
jgi:sulfite oxidase